MSANYDVIFNFPIYGQFEANWVPEACYVTLTFSLIATFYLTKIENRTKKSPTQLSHYCFE